jgi:hypothetical protein
LIRSAEQHLKRFSGNLQPSFLRGHKTVFQRMGQLDHGVELHDTRRPFDRMSRPHEGRQAGGILRVLLQGQQPFT